MADELNKNQEIEDVDDVLSSGIIINAKPRRKAGTLGEKRKKFKPRKDDEVMENIPDLDYSDMDAFLGLESEPTIAEVAAKKTATPKKPGRRRKKLPKDAVSEILEGNRVVREDKTKIDDSIGTAVSAVVKHAKKIKKNFNIRFMNADSTKQKIQILENKIKEYLEIGDEESANACIEQLEMLKTIVLKTRESSEAARKHIKDSKELKQYRSEIKALKERLSQINPVMIERRLYTLRKDCEDIEVANKYNKIDDNYTDSGVENIDNVAEFDDVFDEEESTSKIPSKAELDKLMKYISQLTDTPVSILEEMKTHQIKVLIEESTPELKEERARINQEIENKRAEMYALKNKLRGYSDITDAMFEIFDYETIEQTPKELEEAENVLAASMVEYTIGIAYKTCERLGMHHLFDDAVGAGLATLAVKIKDWMKIQKSVNCAVSFVDICSASIAESIRTALNELAFSGMASGSTINNKLKQEKDAEERLLANIRSMLGEHAADIPDRLLIAAYTADNEHITSASPNTIGNAKANSIEGLAETIGHGGKDESDDVDPYNFISSRDSSAHKIGEGKLMYSNFIDSIKALFSLFDTNKTDRIFEPIDYLVFKMKFGFMQIKDEETGIFRPYTQAEMAPVLFDWELKHPDKVNHNRKDSATGKVSRPMTQSAVNTRIKQLIAKLKKACELYPEIKEGLKYCLTFICSHPEIFSMLSGSEDIRLEDKNRILSKFDKARENELKYQEILVDEEPSTNRFDDINEISAAITEIHEWQEFYKKTK